MPILTLGHAASLVSAATSWPLWSPNMALAGAIDCFGTVAGVADDYLIALGKARQAILPSEHLLAVLTRPANSEIICLTIAFLFAALPVTDKRLLLRSNLPSSTKCRLLLSRLSPKVESRVMPLSEAAIFSGLVPGTDASAPEYAVSCPPDRKLWAVG